MWYAVKLLTQPADSQEEITARHHIADQLERRFIPRPLCKSSLFAEFNNELKILKEAVHSGSGSMKLVENISLNVTNLALPSF